MEDLTKCIICGSENFVHLFQCKDHFLSLEIFSISQCRNCGFIFTNPRPPALKLSKYYDSKNYISHAEKAENIIDKVYNKVRKYTLKKKYELVLKYKSNIKDSKTILDIGCGTGEFLKVFKNNSWQTLGVEPNKSAREIAITKNELEVLDEQGLFDFSNEHFDVITMWHVLEHVSDINSHLTQIKRILKKDGVLIVAVPNAESPDAQMYKQCWAAYDVPRHLYHFTKKSIENLFNNFDLEVVNIHPMKFDAFYVSLLSEKYKSGKSNYMNAFINGLKSNIKASKNNNYSSLIFVLKNKIID